MEILRCRTRLAVLWIIRSLIPVFILFLSYFEPGTLEDLMAGNFWEREITEGLKIGLGVVFLDPLDNGLGSNDS